MRRKSPLEDREGIPQSGLPGGNIFTSNTSANVSGLTDWPEALTGTYRDSKEGKNQRKKEKSVGVIEKIEKSMFKEVKDHRSGGKAEAESGQLEQNSEGARGLLLKSNRLSVFCLRKEWNTWKGKCRMRFTEERDKGWGQGKGQGLQE